MNAPSADNVSVSYEKHLVVDRVTFDVVAGDMLGIIGTNGAR